MPAALPFVSGPSANAILSDLRPTTLTADALDYVNDFLDELLVSLITAAQSINPVHLRTRGVPAVFNIDRDREGFEHALHSHSSVGSLGHSAVGEAELEIRGWYDAHPTARKGVSGFPPGGTGNGVAAAPRKKNGAASSPSALPTPSAPAFPVDQAIELMRVKVSMFSTFAPTPPSQETIDEVTEIWKGAGGDVADETISPAGLWITAILEHVSEHILTKLSQVVARDSSVTAAGIQDLYTALCEDVSVYGFFQHMGVRNKLETEIHAETRRRRPQRTASGCAIPQASSQAGGPSGTSIGSPHSSKTSLASTHGDPRKSNVTSGSRPSTETYLKGTPRGSSSSSSTPTTSTHRRTPSVLSISTKQTASDSIDPFANKRFSSDKAEEDFDAFLRSGETMRVSLTPSRFSTFESSPSSSPSRLHGHEQQNRTNGLSSQSSLSQSSLLSTSTQASTVDSTRISMSYRQAAGRSWSSVSKMVPRNAAIEEKEEENVDRPSVLELIKKENPPGKHDVHVVRTVPAVILGSPPSSPDPDTPNTQRSELPTRHTSLSVAAASVPASEPSDSPRGSPQVLPRSLRSASEGAPDLPPNGTFRRNMHRSERIEAQQETREMAAFFFNSAPPKPTPIAVPIHAEDNGPRQQKHRMSSFKSLMSLMKKDKAKDVERRPLTKTASAQTLRSPTPSDGPLRTQKSSSSSASGSTVMGLNNAPSVEPRRIGTLSPEPSQDSRSSSPAKGREVRRKPSLVRKWAQSVTPRSLSSSPLPQVGDEEREEAESTSSHAMNATPPASANSTASNPQNLTASTASNMSVSSHNRPASPSGLGLGGIEFPEAFVFRSDADGGEGQGPEAALAQLTASSKSSSPVGGKFDLESNSPRESPRSSPRTGEFRHSPRPPFRETSLRSSPLHQRVLELAREGDDNHASIPPPLPPSSPSSPEISSGLGAVSAVSVDGSVTSDQFMSANEDMDDDDDDEARTAEPDGKAETPDPDDIRTPEIGTDASEAETTPRREKARAEAEIGSSVRTDTPSSATLQPEGSIPISDLVPLRHLLDNATSARECQLLLDAILSQLGVPRTPASALPSPEDRVAAWLLAGREGPVGDVLPTAATARRRPAHMRAASSPVLGGYKRPLSRQITMKTLPSLPHDEPVGGSAEDVAAPVAP